MTDIKPVVLNNGRTIPQLGLGVWKSKEGEETKRAVLSALEIGYRLLDTAQIYHNEKSVGEAIAESGVPREEIFLTTKLWLSNFPRRRVAKSFEDSLKTLGTEYVDLFLLHFPVPVLRNKAWDELLKLQNEQKALSVGVSNYTISHLVDLMKSTGVAPAVNQVEFHPFLYQEKLSEFCALNNIVLEAYSPLAHGEKLKDKTVTEVAAKYNCSPAQVLIAWSLQHGNVVIPKSTNPARIKENFESANLTIADDDMTILDSLNENLRTCWDPTHVI